MQLNLHIKEGGWGETPVTDVEALSRAVIKTFAPGLEPDARFNILLAHAATPRALSALSADGEHVIHLNCSGAHWAQLTYQLGHEFTHVIAEPTTWRPDRFAWLEEVFCEVGSLFALQRLSETWITNPPLPAAHYCFHLVKYRHDYLADPRRTLSAGLVFRHWLQAKLPSLEERYDLRETNTVVARHLAPIVCFRQACMSR